MADADTEVGRASLLTQAVSIHDRLVGDPAALGPMAEGIAAAARRTGETEALVVALRAVAWAERLQLHNARALRLLDEAAARARRGALRHRLGEVLVSRAAVNLELGRTIAARGDLDRAGALVDDAAVPDLELKRGLLFHQIGHHEAAVSAYRRVLTHPHAGVDLRCRAANNLALDAASTGRVREALRHIDLAVGLAGQVGPALTALVAQNRGLVLTQCGRLADGLRQLDAAIELLATAGLPLGEAYAESAETLAGLRALPEARELAARAVRELETHDVPLMAAEAQLELATTALLMGDHTAALQDAEAAVFRFRQQRRTSMAALATIVATEARRLSGDLAPADVDRACRAADALGRCGLVSGAVGADLAVGRAAAVIGRMQVARRRLRSAHRRSRPAPVLVRLQGHLGAALAAEQDGDGRAVLRHCRAGLADLAAHRSALASMELRALAAGHGVELGQLGLGCLLRAGVPARVLEWTEQTRAAALLAVDPPAPDAVREERAELAAVQAELVEARRATGAEPAELLARQAAVEARIRRATWHRAVPGTRSGARSAREIRDLLGDRSLVSFIRHGDEVMAVVTDRHRARLVPLGPVGRLRREADGLLFALRRLARWGRRDVADRARRSAERSLDCLRHWAMQPLGVDPEAPLVVVPTGDTHRVPWSALHDGPVSVAPSASAWAASCTRDEAAGPVVVVAGPDLAGAEREAEVVAARHPGAVVLTASAATTGAVLQAMAGADLAHLACHGDLRADNPIFSALRMADRPLTLHEIDLCGVAPRRIVLAACDSAAGAEYAGDEVLGFVGALLARGTAGLVASVVAVGDAESVALMDRLHSGLAAGRPVAEALHAARARVDTADPRQFANWCAFTAYGAG